MTNARVLLAGGMALLGACANATRTTASWQDRTAQPMVLHRTLAVFMTKESGMRRMVEDKMASRLPGGVPSYRIIPDAALETIDSVRAQIIAGQFDGAVVMRFIGVATEINELATAHSFYGYWGYWGSAYDPAWVTSQNVYTIETTLYSVRDDRLVWMNRSEITDPDDASHLADRAVKHAIKKMGKDGYLIR